jgi:hypothetical protein
MFVPFFVFPPKWEDFLLLDWLEGSIIMVFYLLQAELLEHEVTVHHNKGQ